MSNDLHAVTAGRRRRQPSTNGFAVPVVAAFANALIVQEDTADFAVSISVFHNFQLSAFADVQHDTVGFPTFVHVDVEGHDVFVSQSTHLRSEVERNGSIAMIKGDRAVSVRGIAFFINDVHNGRRIHSEVDVFRDGSIKRIHAIRFEHVDVRHFRRKRGVGRHLVDAERSGLRLTFDRRLEHVVDEEVVGIGGIFLHFCKDHIIASGVLDAGRRDNGFRFRSIKVFDAVGVVDEFETARRSFLRQANTQTPAGAVAQTGVGELHHNVFAGERRQVDFHERSTVTRTGQGDRIGSRIVSRGRAAFGFFIVAENQSRFGRDVGVGTLQRQRRFRRTDDREADAHAEHHSDGQHNAKSFFHSGYLLS